MKKIKKLILVVRFLASVFVGSNIVKTSESSTIEQPSSTITFSQEQDSSVRITSELLEILVD